MVLISLGSNRGDSPAIVADALERLRAFADGAFRASQLWRTSPVDCPPGSGDFINAAAAFRPRPELTPEDLLTALKALEAEFGRGQAHERNAPRELDLDLILFGDERRRGDAFTLPHPRATSRRFVLAPAAEVAPEQRWPGLDVTVAELLAQLDSDERVTRLTDHVPA